METKYCSGSSTVVLLFQPTSVYEHNRECVLVAMLRFGFQDISLNTKRYINDLLCDILHAERTVQLGTGRDLRPNR